MTQLKTILQSKVFYIILIILITFYVILNIFIIKNKSIYNDSNTIFYGIITNIKENEYGYSFTLKSKEKLICYSNNLNYQLGDFVKVEGKLSKPLNNTILNDFNYKLYLEHNKIYYILQVEKIDLIKENRNILYKIKNNMLHYINNFKSKDYLKTFLIADTSLDDNIYKSFQINNISHLLSFSSIYISSLIYLITTLFKKNNFLYKFSNIVIFLLLLIIFLLTNYNIIVTKIFILFILKQINRKLKFNLNSIKLFILLTIITLLINPYYIFHKGFLFAYSICFIIILNKNNIKGNYLIKLIKISFITFIYSIPFNIYFNYSINLLSIVYNILFIPVFNMIVIPFSILILFIPILDSIYFDIINLIVKLSLLLNKLTFGTIIFKKMSIFILIIYLIIFAYTIYNFFNKKKIYILIICAILIIHYNINSIIKKDFFIVIDVGQGDSSLFCSSNQCILVDTGGIYNKNVSEKSINMLKSLGIRKIEKLYLTHGDYDHMGDSIYFVNNFKVSEIVLNSNELNELELNLIDELNSKHINYVLGIRDTEYHFNNLHLKLLNYNLDNENDSSLVMYIIFNNKKILLMGDASYVVEDKLLKSYALSNIDCLKVGHHGSKTSSSLKFLNTLKPKMAFISVGINNRYNHPNKEVIERLEKIKSKIYKTSTDGSIIGYFKNNKLEIYNLAP